MAAGETAGTPEGGTGLRTWILAGVAGVALMAGLAWAGTRGVAESAMKVQGVLAENAKRAGVTVTDSGLQFEEVRAGTGESPAAGDMVLLNYEGKLPDGTTFDSSYESGQPAVFPVDGLIPGFSEALKLMRPGGEYRIMIPPDIAYGEKGAGGLIPPNAVLTFKVELLAVAPGGAGE